MAWSAKAGVSVSSGTGNQILGNAIHHNSGLGIDLGTLGMTPNDDLDADTGGNELQNYPIIASAETDGSSSINITGSLNSSRLLTSGLRRTDM